MNFDQFINDIGKLARVAFYDNAGDFLGWNEEFAKNIDSPLNRVKSYFGSNPEKSKEFHDFIFLWSEILDFPKNRKEIFDGIFS